MPPAIVGLPPDRLPDPKPMDRRPRFVKLRSRGGSVSRAPKPPVSGYNPFSPESDSDPVHERIQSWRPFDSGATFSDPSVTSLFGFSSSTNVGKHKDEEENVSLNSVKGANSSSANKGSDQTGWGPFIFGSSTQKPLENNLKDGKENKPVFVFGASESTLGTSNLPEKVQTWHPFNSDTESKGIPSQGDGFVFGEKSKGNHGTQEKIPVENGSSDLNRNFTFGGSISVPEGKDATANADFLREKLERTVHISNSSVPEEKVENVIGKFAEENSTNEKQKAGSFVPGCNEGPASTLPEEMKKLNLQNAKMGDGLANGDADVLPEKVEKLNLGSGSGNLESKPPVYIFGTKVNESTGSRKTSSESTYAEKFVFGSSANTFGDNMKNFKTSKEAESHSTFSFNFRDWETEAKIPETALPDAMKKLGIGASKKTGLRDKKGKKKPNRLGKPKMVQPGIPSLVPEYSDRASSSEKDEQIPVTEPALGSPAGYSPMDCSPYRENYASDETHNSTSLEVESEIGLAFAAERLEIKQETLNENENSRSKEAEEKEVKGEGDEISASGTTSVAFNAGINEEAVEGMDYVGSSSVNAETGSTVSGSSFRFTASTSTQGPVPVIRKHFRRKNRVNSSSVQPSSEWTDASTSPVRMSVDSGRQETRSRVETKKEMAGTSGGALEACEKWRTRCCT